MASGRAGMYGVDEVRELCARGDSEEESDIDSQTGGMSSTEEEELDRELLGISDSDFELK